MTTLIAQDKLTNWMKKVPDWEIEDEGRSISRPLEFDEYMQGMDFANDVAEIAEECGHHPILEIGWCKVLVSISTHSKGGLTEMDFELASRIDTLID